MIYVYLQDMHGRSEAQRAAVTPFFQALRQLFTSR
jgi:hypothetical protein